MSGQGSWGLCYCMWCGVRKTQYCALVVCSSVPVQVYNFIDSYQFLCYSFLVELSYTLFLSSFVYHLLHVFLEWNTTIFTKWQFLSIVHISSYPSLIFILSCHQARYLDSFHSVDKLAVAVLQHFHQISTVL